MTPDLIMHGDHEYHYMTDVEGFTIVKDKNEMYVYATRNETSGDLMPSNLVVGRDDPVDHGLQKRLVPANMEKRKLKTKHVADQESRRLQVPTLLKNLVILIRFSNHKDLVLPTVEDFDKLFNKPEGDPIVAPTGSVRDYYNVSSYGKFTLDSKVFGWVNLSNTESYYADGMSGFGSLKYVEALYEALDVMQKQYGLSFVEFDADANGLVDMVTLVHSGYAAEVPGVDQFGATVAERIWSHQRTLPTSKYWTSASGVKVYQYATTPSLWDKTGNTISRIGVVTHEIGHCLRLPDLYGTPLGSGIGSYDVMSNDWGFTPYSLGQLYPPIISAWTKIDLGWLDPVKIIGPGNYNITASATTDQAYRIDIGNLGTEYLLIENRQPVGFDLFLPQGGLAIWHIDEAAPNVEGYPGQTDWPSNGKHYKVALLQADGNYDLERGINRGDKGDLFHGPEYTSLTPSESLLGPFPNTDAYQDGIIRKTGVEIYEVSTSAHTMSFSVKFSGVENPTMSPTQLATHPRTSSPTLTTKRLLTTFAGGNGASGNMFDVVPLRNITITEIEVHTSEPGPIVVELWTKEGTYVSYDKDPLAWNRLTAAELEGLGRGVGTPMQVGDISMIAGKRRAFYVTSSGTGLRYTNGNGTGQFSNDDLILYEGVGKATPFGYTFNDRIWNGIVYYHLTASEATPAPSSYPTQSPTSSPTAAINSLLTTFAGGTGQAGNMFDLQAYNDVYISGFDLNVLDEREVQVEMYTKHGTFVGSENDCEAWTLFANVTVIGAGMGRPTSVPIGSFSPVLIMANYVQAFYLTLTTSTSMRYTPGVGTGTRLAYDQNLAIFEGVGKAYPCGGTFWNRIWNGAVYYERASTFLAPPIVSEDHKTEHTKELEIIFASEADSIVSSFHIYAKHSLSLIGMKVCTNRTELLKITLQSIICRESCDAFDVTTVIVGEGGANATLIPSTLFAPIMIMSNNSLEFSIYVAANDTKQDYEVGIVLPSSSDDAVISNSGHEVLATSEGPNILKAIFDYIIVDM